MPNRKIQTKHSVCLLLPPVPLWPLVFAVASYSPKVTNESSQNLSVSCPKHNRTKQLSTMGVSECRSLALVAAQHWMQTGHSSQDRLRVHSSTLRTGKRQTGNAALANASQALGRVSVLCPRKPPQRVWSWFLFPQREKKTCRRREKQRSLSGNERARTVEH